jgi:hypothetical protein
MTVSKAVAGLVTSAVVVSAGATSASAESFAPPTPKRPKGCSLYYSENCKAWDRQQAVERLLVNGATTDAGLVLLFQPMEKVKGATAGVPVSTIRNAWRTGSVSCRSTIMGNALWANYEYYQGARDVFKTKLWAEPLMNVANGGNPTRVGGQIYTVVASKAGVAAGKAAQRAYNASMPNPYAEVLSGAIGMGQVLAAQRIAVNRIGSMRIACLF